MSRQQVYLRHGLSDIHADEDDGTSEMPYSSYEAAWRAVVYDMLGEMLASDDDLVVAQAVRILRNLGVEALCRSTNASRS